MAFIAVDKRWNDTSTSHVDLPSTGPVEHHFSPYQMHGGTVLGIAGKDFAVMASDTRLSEGFTIHSRRIPKLYNLGENIVLACCGFHGDVLTLQKVLKMEMKSYLHEHKQAMNTGALAQLLSSVLYWRRFFPYYTYNVLGGLDAEGKGCVFSYDPVGSHERESHRCSGSASAIIQPFLDSQIKFGNQEKGDKPELTIERAVALAKDAFISAAERDINTGDAVMVRVITKDGVKEEVLPLRRD